ncbi:hypothetical protein ACIQ9P_04165 [Kitasatospora sp. NPDC094019]|uniref:hypothetical protein n=1 Tax=Kitasatospora sp. NPDC094019 TaxID=3364091 RepID=UPI003825A862
MMHALGEEFAVKLIVLAVVGGLEIALQFVTHHHLRKKEKKAVVLPSRTRRLGELHRAAERRRSTSGRVPTPVRPEVRVVAQSRRPLPRRVSRRRPGARRP